MGALGRSLVPTNKVSKVALRQIFGNLGNGGLLGALAAPATDAAASSGTNIMEDMAMNMAQQQIEQMLSSGQLEEMAMEFLSSGQMEQMVQDFMADPETEHDERGGDGPDGASLDGLGGTDGGGMEGQ